LLRKISTNAQTARAIAVSMLPFSGRCKGALQRAHRVPSNTGAMAAWCAKSHDGQTITDDI
jgi:hypothetical protein